jgi:hypothetical protein
MRARGRPKGSGLTQAERLAERPALARIKSRHHLVARLLAAGLTRNQVASITGYSPQRISQFDNDPAMADLVATYRADPEILGSVGVGPLDQLRHLAIQAALRSMAHMHDTMDYYDDADEKMPIRESAKIFEIASDRVGFGKHSTNININADFALQLDRARERRMKVVEERPSAGMVVPPVQHVPSVVVSLPSRGVGEGEADERRLPPPSRIERRV